MCSFPEIKPAKRPQAVTSIIVVFYPDGKAIHRKDAPGIVFLMVDICCGKPPVPFNESLLLQAMISNCVTVPELDLSRTRIVMYDIGHHICSARSVQISPTAFHSCGLQAILVSSHMLLYSLASQHFLYLQHLCPHSDTVINGPYISWEERTTVSRTSEDQDLYFRLGSLEIPWRREEQQREA